MNDGEVKAILMRFSEDPKLREEETSGNQEEELEL